MTTTKHELIERVRLIVREMQADNAVNVARTAAVLNMMKQIENDEATVVLPQPCNGPLYDGLTPDEFLNKVYEEVDELAEEIWKNEDGRNLKRVCLEATDAITALTTLLDRIGCNEEMRQKYQREVNESNARRDGGQRISGLAAKKDMNRKAAIN